MDPRLRARRAEVRREAARRRQRYALAVFGVVALLSLGYAGATSSLLDVDRIVVSGAERSGAATVRELLADEMREPVLFVDSGALARRVEALPWVVEARVGRRLPGTLTVAVVEQDAGAWLRDAQGTVLLVGEDGTVLGSAPEAPGETLELVGLRSVPEVGGVVSPLGLGGLRRELPERLGDEVSQVRLERRDIVLALRDGGEVRLGGLDDLGAKGAAALAVLDRLAGGAFAYIDVSVPGAPVVGGAPDS